MTLKEKQTKIDEWCDTFFESNDCDCEGCPFDNEHSWCRRKNANQLTEVEADAILTTITELECKKAVKESDNVEHPKHYNREKAMECIDEMLMIFGSQMVINFCILNAWKYRYRAADKNGIEDLKKSDWYLNKAKELMDKRD